MVMLLLLVTTMATALGKNKKRNGRVQCNHQLLRGSEVEGGRVVEDVDHQHSSSNLDHYHSQ